MKKVRLITHNGSFHADDIFATATLGIMLEKEGKEYEVIRTRDEELFKTGDYVYDVGGIYDEATNRFDHHQPGGAGKSEYGIEYSSFGLVWKKFGVSVAGGEKEALVIEKKLCAPIDAVDNGIDLVEQKGEISPLYIHTFFYAMLPTWKETDEDIDKIFIECVALARKVLEREIIQARDLVEAEDKVWETYKNSSDKRIIVLEKSYPFEYILPKMSEPLYAIYPRKTNGDWGVKAVRENNESFKNRKNLPTAWAGLRDQELQEITGVSDAIFCHRSLFLVVAGSQEGAVKLAQIAVES